jgi:hypothetical protein
VMQVKSSGLAIGSEPVGNLGMTKLTPKNKAKRQEIRSERKAAKQERKDRRELEKRSEPTT